MTMTREQAMKQADERMAALVAKMEAERIKAEAEQEYRGYKVADIRRVFDAISDPEDWRAPISRWIPCDMVGIAQVAVEFFTCTELKVVAGPQALTGYVLVRADGYRMGPAGP